MAEILIVDDDPVVLKVVKDQLEIDGHRVQVAGDWPAMNEALFASRIAVLLLDVNLPGLKGNTLAEIVSRNLRVPPAIVLHSGLPEAELRRLSREVGAVNYLCKGQPMEVLHRVVRAAVGSHERMLAQVPSDTAPAPRRAPASATAADSRPGVATKPGEGAQRG